MPKRQTEISLADAHPGMTLSGAILDAKGHLLLPKGIALTEAILESLQRHQVATIIITDTKISETEENIQGTQCLKRIDQLFRKQLVVPDDDTMLETLTATDSLYQLIRRFRLNTSS